MDPHQLFGAEYDVKMTFGDGCAMSSAPAGLDHMCTLPTAYAVGYNMPPLSGLPST